MSREGDLRDEMRSWYTENDALKAQVEEAKGALEHADTWLEAYYGVVPQDAEAVSLQRHIRAALNAMEEKT